MVVVAGVALVLLARPLLSAKHEAKAAQSDLTSAKDALKNDDRRRRHATTSSRRAPTSTRRRATPVGSGATSGRSIPIAGGAVDDERLLVDALDQTHLRRRARGRRSTRSCPASQRRSSAASGSTWPCCERSPTGPVRDRPAPRPGDERPRPGRRQRRRSWARRSAPPRPPLSPT